MTVPPWEWTITFLPGAICRSIMCGTKEVALCNPSCDWTDAEESDLARGLAYAAKMHMLLAQIATEGPNDGTVADITRLLHQIDTVDTGRYVEPEDD